nr:MAG TPA: tail protein [Caudoviricetes sp.]
MLLTVYDSNRQIKAVLSPDDSSTQVKALQGDNVLTLSFTLYEHVALEVNDYVDFCGERYWLLERYLPEEVSTQEWKYDVKFYGIESLIKRFLVLNVVDGDPEPVFTLTAPPREHVALVVKSVNDGLGGITDWKVGTVEGTENIVIDYEGKYCHEALKEIAEAVGGQAEWWIEGQTVNVCRCEDGEELPLAYGRGLTGLSRDKADGAKFYTRLFPIGSSRNIDPEKYGHSRLQLPGGAKYVDVDVEKYGIHHHYEADAFAGIYPRRVGTVTSVRSEEVTGEDGEPFTIWYFRDDTLTFDPNDYELGGKVKRVSFQEGCELAGLGEEEDGTYYFEVNFNSDTREFEIITIWPYSDDTQLPGGNLVPKSGDCYILWNIRMPDEYYGLAEEEYLTAVNRYNAENAVDVSVYKGPTDHVWVEKNSADLYVGRRVRLESEEYFPETGFRSSRVTKVTRKVTLPSQMDLEISDALSTGVMESLTNRIDEVRNYTKTAVSGANLPDIIRSWDNTLPTDNNLFSARRSQNEFISKKKADRAKKRITFEEGIGIGLEENAGIDGKGNAELLTLVVRELLRSPKFVDGLFGEGWRLWMENALSHLTIDKLTVRQVMVVLEMLIEKVRSVGGQLCVSAANGKIKAVEEQDGLYKITFEQDNTFVAHDLMRCATFTGGSLKSYWVEVAGVEGDSILVAADEFGASLPVPGDECVLMGNTENPLRQNLILISATEDGQPRIDILDGVKAKNFNGCLRCRLGKLDGIRSSAFPADKQPKGNGLYADNVWLKGTFVLMTGEDILTRFEITEGKIHSAVESLRKEIREEQSYLDNSSFADGMDKWKTGSKATLFTLGGRWIWANGGPYGTKPDGHAEIRTDGKVPYAYIRNSYIMQKLEDFRLVPEYRQTNSQGERVPGVVYLSFSYRVIKAGRLKIEFVNADKTGFENFNMFGHEEDLPVGGEKMFTLDGLWNGTGDFKLSFTGVIYISLLVFSTNKADALAYKYRTLFEQSDRLVKISAAVFDKDGNALKETGLVIKPEGSGLYAQDNTGKIALIGVSVEEEDEYGNTVSKIKLTADHIQLEGLVTANGNFKILEDGSIETTNGKFTGEIDSSKGKIGGFEIGNGRIGSVADSHGSGGGLAIYDDFFRVGGSKGYVMFGDDVIPSSAGGAFTAVGRIVNSAPNIYGNYGFDQANYGLFIDVTGGTKNYGISSNAALLAPAFINTKAKLLTFGSGNYTVDFSQHNIILMYYNEPNYSKVEVTLPSESSVAYKFGMSYLPTDFAAIVTFRVRPGSKNIILKGIYNHNEDLQNYEMASGDSVTVLITKADGFRYQILNHSS